jgi:hypothetical protein
MIRMRDCFNMLLFRPPWSCTRAFMCTCGQEMCAKIYCLYARVCMYVHGKRLHAYINMLSRCVHACAWRCHVGKLAWLDHQRNLIQPKCYIYVSMYAYQLKVRKSYARMSILVGVHTVCTCILKFLKREFWRVPRCLSARVHRQAHG